MPNRPGTARVRTKLLALVRGVPIGRVASAYVLPSMLGVPPPLVATMLSQLTEDERRNIPWHRVVAKGGAIGRGSHRDRQFAELVREGVAVSPAGVVQDLPRVMMMTLDAPGAGNQTQPDALPQPAKPGGRSRGMKVATVTADCRHRLTLAVEPSNRHKGGNTHRATTDRPSPAFEISPNKS